MADYFATFTKRYLVNESADVADVEALSSDLGDQPVVTGRHLVGITYEPKRNALEVEFESGNVRAFQPKEVWVVEEENGFMRAVEIVRDDDTRELIQVHRLALRKRDD
jgi:hypothetical protein